MSAIMDLVELHPKGDSEESFRFECGGGKLGVEACGDRLTPYGGLAAWSHYLERIGIVEDLAKRCPVERTSPNATPVRDILHGFMVNALMGGKRFAHIRRMQDDRAVAAILGLKRGRICGEDAFVRMTGRANREKARLWMGASERDLYAALPPSFIADWDSTVNTRYGHQEEVEVGYNRRILETVLRSSVLHIIETVPARYPFEDVEGRLWDCIWMARQQAGKCKEGDNRFFFELILHRSDQRSQYTQLVCDCGPGDNGEPVLTIGFAEDF